MRLVHLPASSCASVAVLLVLDPSRLVRESLTEMSGMSVSITELLALENVSGAGRYTSRYWLRNRHVAEDVMKLCKRLKPLLVTFPWKKVWLRCVAR